MSHRALLFSVIAALVAVIAWLVWHPGVQPSSPPIAASTKTKRSPALPAPKVSPAPSLGTSLSDQEPPAKALLSNMQQGKLQITAAQLQGYLDRNHRNAESLLIVARLTKDIGLLREAAQKFPNDPRVQFELANESNNPAERQQALAAMAANDPDNSLGCYLAAAESLKSGKSDDAVRWLMQANERGHFDDYLMANVQATEEALIASGTPPLEARVTAMFGAGLPHISSMRDMSKQLMGMQQAYSQSGDSASSQAMLDIGLALGERMQDNEGSGRTLISNLVGLSIERQFLRSLDPNAIVPGTNQTAEQRLEANNARQQLISQMAQGFDPSVLNPQDLALYLDRSKVLSEISAMQWLRNRLGPSSTP